MTEQNPTDDAATDQHPEDGPETAPESPGAPEPDPEAPEDENDPESGAEDSEDDPLGSARGLVTKLRRQAGNYRARLRDSEARSEDLATRLHTALVAATGRLQDPADLDFDPDHLDDQDALNASVDELLAIKPHLGKRTPRGDIGQGAGGETTATDLAGILRARA